jgi:predicted nucleotide-binding protein
MNSQLFKVFPTEEICLEVLLCFGLKSLDDTTNFSKKDLETLGTVKKLYFIKSKLEQYYIPCKARTYLNELSPKNCITILRQILKVYERTVTSREKYIRGVKYVIYQIIPKDYKKYKPVEINSVDSNYLILFD